MFPLIKMLKHSSLCKQAYNCYCKRCTDEGHPESHFSPTEYPGDCKGHKGPDHIERAMGYIRNTQHSKDKAQARGDDKKDHRAA